MAVYVDELRKYHPNQIQPAARRFGNQWCHMFADSRDELIAFAEKLGLRASYVQHDDEDLHRHFDLIPSKRELAIKLGAKEKTTRQWVEEWIAKRDSNAS